MASCDIFLKFAGELEVELLISCIRVAENLAAYLECSLGEA